MKKKCGFGIATGLLSIIFGIIVLAFDGGRYSSGQNVIADTAKNVNALIGLVKLGLGFLLIVIGLLAIMYFLVQTSKCTEGQSVVHPQNETELRDRPASSNYWICEKCGERKLKTRKFCGSCGELK